jgi:endonuclease/exonuclease/phosphatase family metal-dependent hydrolase
VLIRTWNLFHGNTKPPQRRAFLDEMVRLSVAYAPDVVCLQEIPAWALPKLGEWSGYAAIGALAARPMLGPLPSTAEVGRVLTSIDHGVLRSAFSGQGNSILVAPHFRVEDRHVLELNPRRFRRRQAEWLGLGVFARLAWGKERRVCQVVRLRAGERTFVLGNLHATSYPPDERLADAELLRAAVYADGIALPDEPLILCGDFNVTFERSRTLLDLSSPDWGFSRPGGGIDQIVVRGFELERGPEPWPPGRRERDGALLSDHAPVEAVVA